MGNTHSWKTHERWMSERNVDDINALIDAAQSEYGVKLYDDLGFVGSAISPSENEGYEGSGKPTVYTNRIRFAAHDQSEVDIEFAYPGEDTVFTNGEGKPNMLTGAIMLYLAENGVIDYHTNGIALDKSNNQSVLIVDSVVSDSYNFVENTLGSGTLDDIGAIAMRGREALIDVNKPFELKVLDGDIAWNPKPRHTIPLSMRPDHHGSGGSGVCASWMPRANESCVLFLGHAGAHRSR